MLLKHIGESMCSVGTTHPLPRPHHAAQTHLVLQAINFAASKNWQRKESPAHAAIIKRVTLRALAQCARFKSKHCVVRCVCCARLRAIYAAHDYRFDVEGLP